MTSETTETAETAETTGSEGTDVSSSDPADIEAAESQAGVDAPDEGPEDAVDAVGAEDAEDAGDSEDADATEGTDRLKQLEAEGDIAADYLEELLDIADLDGDLDMDVEGDRAVVSIVGADLNQLVGADGEVLEAVQELTRLAVYRETGERSRLMLDISGYRAEKRRELEELAARTVERVNADGEPVSLDPMTPFERKVVHDAVAAAGLTSASEGVEPRRFVVVLPG